MAYGAVMIKMFSSAEGANVNLHALKANVVLPATQKHVQKYSDSPRYIVEETPELYHFVTLPFLKTEKFTIDWVRRSRTITYSWS